MEQQIVSWTPDTTGTYYYQCSYMGEWLKNNRSIVKLIYAHINIMIFKKYLKDPLSTIAVNTTIFIAGCLFWDLAIGIVSEFVRDYKNPPKNLRQQHIQQHLDEQVKYDKMIQLLDSINNKLN